jgi:hypothetical protein
MKNIFFCTSCGISLGWKICSLSAIKKVTVEINFKNEKKAMSLKYKCHGRLPANWHESLTVIIQDSKKGRHNRDWMWTDKKVIRVNKLKEPQLRLQSLISNYPISAFSNIPSR